MTKHGRAFQRLSEELRTADARIAELEAQLAAQAEDHTPLSAIETLFMAGVNQCMRDEENGREHGCPYPRDSISRHWWTRGYAHQARAFRAVELEARLKDVEKKRDEWEADWTQTELARVQSVERAEKAEARAEAAEAKEREMGEECRRMTDEIERLSVAVEWVLQEIREKIAVERGLKTASIEEYFRMYKRISIGFYDKDVARLQAALSPSEQEKEEE